MINNVVLPDRAKSKLRDLELARMGAEDASRAAASRLNNLPRDVDQQLRDKLANERSKQTYRHGQLSQLLFEAEPVAGRVARRYAGGGTRGRYRAEERRDAERRDRQRPGGDHRAAPATGHC